MYELKEKKVFVARHPVAGDWIAYVRNNFGEYQFAQFGNGALVRHETKEGLLAKLPHSLDGFEAVEIDGKEVENV